MTENYEVRAKGRCRLKVGAREKGAFICEWTDTRQTHREVFARWLITSLTRKCLKTKGGSHHSGKSLHSALQGVRARQVLDGILGLWAAMRGRHPAPRSVFLRFPMRRGLLHRGGGASASDARGRSDLRQAKIGRTARGCKVGAHLKP